MNSSLWTVIIGPLIASLAILANLYINLWRKTIRHLRIKITFSLPNRVLPQDLKSSQQTPKDEFNSSNLFRVFIKITYLGNKALLRDHFDNDNLIIKLINNIKILKVIIVKTTPESFSPKCHVEKNSIIIEPMLMNPRDSFELEIWLSDKTDYDSIQIIGKILDGKIIKVDNSKSILQEKAHLIWASLAFIFIFIACFLIFVPFQKAILSEPNIFAIIGTAILVLTFVMSRTFHANRFKE